MLLTLPNELLLTISTSLPSDPDLNNLLRTTKRLYHLLNPTLYHRNVHHPNDSKDQAIFWAISHHQPATIDHLLNATGSACLHARKPMTLQSPLAVAAEQGYPDLVGIFLANGADIGAVDVVGQTPLVTVLRAIADLAEQCRLHESPAVAGTSPSPGAVRKQDTVSVPDARLIAPGQLAAVDLLIRAYSDASISLSTSTSTSTPTTTHGTPTNKANPLHYAARIGDPTLLHTLLTQTPYTNPSVLDHWLRTPLTHAAITGNLAIARYLLTLPLLATTANATTNTNTNTPINTGMSVDPNHRDFRGCTPLTNSIMEGHDAVTEYLLSVTGVDVDARDDRGQSCLSWACRVGRGAVIPLLIKIRGVGGVDVDVDVNVRDTFGKTPLLWAIEGGDVDVLKALLESAVGRVDLSVPSLERGGRSGMMPVEVAREMGREDVVGVLLTYLHP